MTTQIQPTVSKPKLTEIKTDYAHYMIPEDGSLKRHDKQIINFLTCDEYPTTNEEVGEFKPN